MKKFIMGIFLLTGLGFIIYYQIFGNLNRTEQLTQESMNISEEMMNRDSKTAIINIALFGLYQRNHGFEGDTPSHAIKIVSIDTKQSLIKVTSIQRDLLVVLPDQALDKLNHAYCIGGVELALWTLNQKFKIYIYILF